MSILIKQNIVTGRSTCIICNDNSYYKLAVWPHHMSLLRHPPVEVSVDDRLGEVVQVLHSLGHVNGNDELGLQINNPVH